MSNSSQVNQTTSFACMHIESNISIVSVNMNFKLIYGQKIQLIFFKNKYKTSILLFLVDSRDKNHRETA